MRETFSSDNKTFDNSFNHQVERTISEFNFKSIIHLNSEPFNLHELNLTIKNLNSKSSSGEDNIHNLMLINSSQEFRQIILNLVNETVIKSSLVKGGKIH